MQKAEHILSILGQKSKERPDFIFRRFYRYLYNPDLYRYAWEKRSDGYLPPDLYKSIVVLIDQLRSERYSYHHPMEMEFRLLCYVISDLLQAIDQPLPCVKNSFHDLLLSIQSIASPFGWYIEMPSLDFYRSIQSREVCLGLTRRIDDGRFLSLLRHLDDGWLDHWLNLLFQIFDRWITTEHKDIQYMRYHEKIFLLVKGPKNRAKMILEQIDQWMHREFGLEGLLGCARLKPFWKERIDFHGYELKVVNRQVGLFIPASIVSKRLQPFIKKGKPSSCNDRIHLPIEEMIDRYRKERLEFETDYPSAWNRYKKLRYFRYVHFSSLLKTIARKKNLSVKQVRKRYQHLLNHYFDLDDDRRAEYAERRLFGSEGG